jgi:hypothetical protein
VPAHAATRVSSHREGLAATCEPSPCIPGPWRSQGIPQQLPFSLATATPLKTGVLIYWRACRLAVTANSRPSTLAVRSIGPFQVSQRLLVQLLRRREPDAKIDRIVRQTRCGKEPSRRSFAIQPQAEIDPVPRCRANNREGPLRRYHRYVGLPRLNRHRPEGRYHRQDRVVDGGEGVGGRRTAPRPARPLRRACSPDSRSAPGRAATARFSPKGDRLAFDAGTQTWSGVFTCRLDGTDLRRIEVRRIRELQTPGTGEGIGMHVLWSQDGERLSVLHSLGKPAIRVYDPDGSNARRIPLPPLPAPKKEPERSID